MRQAARWVLLACVAGLLVGCAGGGSGVRSGRAGTEIVTEFDEPEPRKRARIRTELAAGYFEEGKTTVALDEVKQALASDPGYGPALNLRGLAYLRLGELQLARESFERALAVNARDADAAHNLGWLHCQSQAYEQAETQFQRALAVPGYANVAKTQLARGVCLARAGRLPEAEQALQRAFELDPGNPVVEYNLARVLFSRGLLAKAQFHLQRLNTSPLANAESLWLGLRVERQLGNQLAERSLGEQLRLKFPQSPQRQLLERGAFDE